LDRSGDLERAIGELRASVRLDPDDATASYNLGRLLLKAGDPQGAAEQMARVAKIHGEAKSKEMNDIKTSAAISQGLKAMATGRLGEAIRAFTLAVETNPRSAEAHNHLGLALAKAGDVEGAKMQFQKAIEIQPLSAIAYNNAGGLLAKEGNIDAAIDQIEKAIALQADLATAHYNLGLLFRQKGDAQRAQAEFDEALRLGYIPSRE